MIMFTYVFGLYRRTHTDRLTELYGTIEILAEKLDDALPIAETMRAREVRKDRERLKAEQKFAAFNVKFSTTLLATDEHAKIQAIARAVDKIKSDIGKNRDTLNKKRALFESIQRWQNKMFGWNAKANGGVKPEIYRMLLEKKDHMVISQEKLFDIETADDLLTSNTAASDRILYGVSEV